MSNETMRFARRLSDINPYMSGPVEPMPEPREPEFYLYFVYVVIVIALAAMAWSAQATPTCQCLSCQCLSVCRQSANSIAPGEAREPAQRRH